MNLHMPTYGKLYMDEKMKGAELAAALRERGYLQPDEEGLWLSEIRVKELPMQVRIQDGGRHYFDHHRENARYVAEVIVNSETLYAILAQEQKREKRRDNVTQHIKESLQQVEDGIRDLFEIKGRYVERHAY